MNEKSLNRKLIKVICDSDDAMSELKRDNTVSPLCDIIHLKDTSLSIHTLEEYPDHNRDIPNAYDDTWVLG